MVLGIYAIEIIYDTHIPDKKVNRQLLKKKKIVNFVGVKLPSIILFNFLR